MTANQIAYLKHAEQARSNLVNEDLTRRRDEETVRHNKAGELYQNRALAESTRHSKATEQLGVDTLQETKRHNLQVEGLDRSRVNISALSTMEGIRHNRAVEHETKRSNVVKEKETERSNRAKESLQNLATSVNYALGTSSQALTLLGIKDSAAKWRQEDATKTNIAYNQLELGKDQLASNNYFKFMDQKHDIEVLMEQIRANKAKEALTFGSEAEKKRHNLATEEFQYINMGVNSLTSLGTSLIRSGVPVM